MLIYASNKNHQRKRTTNYRRLLNHNSHASKRRSLQEPLGALQRAGIIERRSYFVIDSVNYFRVRHPLTVWGFKVESVFGLRLTLESSTVAKELLQPTI